MRPDSIKRPEPKIDDNSVSSEEVSEVSLSLPELNNYVQGPQADIVGLRIAVPKSPPASPSPAGAASPTAASASATASPLAEATRQSQSHGAATRGTSPKTRGSSPTASAPSPKARPGTTGLMGRLGMGPCWWRSTSTPTDRGVPRTVAALRSGSPPNGGYSTYSVYAPVRSSGDTPKRVEIPRESSTQSASRTTSSSSTPSAPTQVPPAKVRSPSPKARSPSPRKVYPSSLTTQRAHALLGLSSPTRLGQPMKVPRRSSVKDEDDAPTPATPRACALEDLTSRSSSAFPCLVTPEPLPIYRVGPAPVPEMNEVVQELRANLERKTTLLALMEQQLKATEERMLHLEAENARMQSVPP